MHNFASGNSGLSREELADYQDFFGDVSATDGTPFTRKLNKAI